MQVFAGADYTSKVSDKRSVSGVLVMCGGTFASWFSTTQKCVTLSITKAEYVALADVLFLRQVLALHVAGCRHAVHAGVRG